jgi:protein-S-isoprenylcysteine O-methyltransferase Ste14
LYLFAGLAAHKILWEVLKQKRPTPQGPPVPLQVRIVKGVKIAILFGIVLQTVLPEVLPIVTPAVPAVRVWGLALFTAGLALAIWARLLLDANWSDIETASVIERQEVVSRGVYKYVRHPIYVGDLLLLLGLELALNSWLFAGVLLMAPVVLRQAIHEEKTLIKNLPGYERYTRRTKRFIPFIA